MSKFLYNLIECLYWTQFSKWCTPVNCSNLLWLEYPLFGVCTFFTCTGVGGAVRILSDGGIVGRLHWSGSVTLGSNFSVGRSTHIAVLQPVCTCVQCMWHMYCTHKMDRCIYPIMHAHMRICTLHTCVALTKKFSYLFTHCTRKNFTLVWLSNVNDPNFDCQRFYGARCIQLKLCAGSIVVLGHPCTPLRMCNVARLCVAEILRTRRFRNMPELNVFTWM